MKNLIVFSIPLATLFDLLCHLFSVVSNQTEVETPKAFQTQLWEVRTLIDTE